MGWIFNFVHERISENMLERVEKNFSKSDKSFKRPTNFVSRKFTNLITLETKHNLDVKNILNYWLVGAGWICWFWAAASLPGLVFLATPPQIPIHFPLFTFFHCDCVLIFHWDDWDLLLFNSTEAVFRVWETFHLKKKRNQKHNTQLFKWNCIFIYNNNSNSNSKILCEN